MELVLRAHRVLIDGELLAAATAAGAEAVPRSRFFRDMDPFIDTKQT